MKKPSSSLFTKILCWFFLNLTLVGVALAIFFAFQPQMNLYAIFRQQGSNRLRIASMLISYDMEQAQQSEWPAVLTRHARINQVDFALVLEDGSCFSSREGRLPAQVIKRSMEILQLKPPWDRSAISLISSQLKDSEKRDSANAPDGIVKARAIDLNPLIYANAYEKKPHIMMRTGNPTRYWFGNRVPLFLKPLQPPTLALLLAISDSATGHGFFFDPLPWMIVAASVIVISVLMWIPMVRNITAPLTRMTDATELIARGRFDVSIHEERADEIGRLANAINRMTSHLSDFVKGQKRFLGDAAHELGSPIARINFGLAALERRVEGENLKRVVEIIDDVDHMSKLVNELLLFSRAEMNRTTVKLATIELLPVVQAAIKREITPESRITTSVDPEICVTASAELLTRAVANVIRNAVKYGKAGEEKVGEDGGGVEIHIKAEQLREEVLIEICDRGNGVPENLINRLFEPFFRPEPSRDRDSGGVGLGLAIVKTCIETCHGTVSARNLEPEGFAVTMVLKKGTV